MLMLLMSLAGIASAQVTDHREIKTPPLRKFSIPQPKRIVLPNGMVIFLQEDHELPLIKGRATIRGGERDSPADKAGMNNIYGMSWRTGGTASQTGDQLDEFLDARAARVETSGGSDASSVSLDVLKADFDTVFPIWVEILRKPEFRQEKIDLAKTQSNTAISRRNDDPGTILGRELLKLGYGADSPYGRHTEYATIASITRDDLLAFHRRTVHPNNIILSFIGDFNTAQMEKRLRDTFASWPRGPQMAKPALTFAGAKPGVYSISKEDVTQANIAMVHAGIERSNPDYFALTVMNEIFGGGFSGRLMQTLRSARGLTYGVGGGVGAGWDHPGLFRLQMATKSGTTLESIEALRGEVNRLVTAPVTEAEMAQAKESILNAFVFTMDTREKALNQQVLLEMYGFPSDYYTKYPSMIEKVSAEDVQRVAKTYVHPDRLAVLVVGNEKEFEKPLSTLGTVTPIDITIPEPGGAKKSAAPAASNDEGRALFAKVMDFVGGQAAVNAVRSTRTVAAMSMMTPQGNMSVDATLIVQYPSSMRQEMTLPMGTMTTVIAPGVGYAITPMGTQDLPASRRDAAVIDMKTDFLHILRTANEKYTFTAGGMEKIGDVDTRILEISPEGGVVRWYIEPATGRLLRTVRTTQMGETTTDYSEWKKFGSVQLPTVAKISRNGEAAGEARVSTIEINPALDATTFGKP
ncbi:MAG TPA: pitrilysin family protein [Thermoanaerobaculia bacterium]|nr:pitrilysin family protein [Thermoanaerobaculia bacterium]